MKGDQCPMYFDDGANPYKEEEERIITFFRGNAAEKLKPHTFYIITLTAIYNYLS